MPRRSFQAGRPPPDLQELVARFGGFSRMPVDECGKFDAFMAAWESAAERGWRGDRDVDIEKRPDCAAHVGREEIDRVSENGEKPLRLAFDFTATATASRSQG